MQNEVLEALYNIFTKDRVKLNETMDNHTTFKVGGPADAFVSPKNIEEIKDTVKALRKLKFPFYILGRGSNVIFTDLGYRGVVISTQDCLDKIKLKQNDNGNFLIKAEAGAYLKYVANFALENELTGFEFAHGIPGSIGGAVFMNAGAYGGEIKDVFVSAKILNSDSEIVTLDKEQMKFGYRKSEVKKNGDIVLSATFELKKADKSSISDLMEDLMAKRRDKQPLEYPSAGSTFKRPEGHFAGKLIMDSGLKGVSIGGASISTKHCGFIINNNNATANDIIDLINLAKKTVHEKFGVELSPEVRIVGE